MRENPPRSADPHGGVCRPGDADYPGALQGLRGAPLQLYWSGPLWPPPRLSVSIVGTRGASPYGLEIAEGLAADLARAGVCVVSGMARGIDAAAHHGALEAGGDSVAVLAADPATSYPPESSAVHRRLLVRGAVCAEYPAGTPLRRGLFLRRNRLLAGLSRGVVVVEAGERSGALVSAAWARRFGRFVAAVPGDVTRDGSRGTLQLLREGAIPVGGAGDVLAPLEALGSETLEEERSMVLLRRISNGPAHPDLLARELGVSLAELLPLLVRLELAGSIRRGPAGRVERSGA